MAFARDRKAVLRENRQIPLQLAIIKSVTQSLIYLFI